MIKDLEIKQVPEPNLTGEEVFGNKRVVLFGLPGAFTPTCSTLQVPGFDEAYDEIKAAGIDEVYVTSVNDGFVMKAWCEGYNNIKYLSDGNGELAAELEMLVQKSNLGFGVRSWRYAAVINDGDIEVMFEEAGKQDDCSTDPFEVSSAENILGYLNLND
jgi:peroxiredoxin